MKAKIVRSVISLIIFGFLAKLLSVLAKVFTTRAVGVEGMGFVALTIPMMMLLFTLCQVGLPTAISKLVAIGVRKKSKIIIVSFTIAFFINIFLLVTLIVFAPWIADTILQNHHTLYSIYALALLTPLVAMSGMLKGYCIGIGQVETASMSQVSEEVARLIFVAFGLEFFTQYGPEYAAMGAIIGMVIGEIGQIIYLVIRMYRPIKNSLPQLYDWQKHWDKEVEKEIFAMSFPVTSIRLITSITYFFEPIIMMQILLNQGYGADWITKEYGLLSSYAMPLLFMPGFFAAAFSTVLLPNMSKAYHNKNYLRTKRLFLWCTFASLVIGAGFAIICLIFPKELLQLLYGNSEGAKYIQAIAIPFILYYVEAPISSAMYAMSLQKQTLYITAFASLVRIIALLLLIPSQQMFGVAIATNIEILIIVGLDLLIVVRRLFFHD